MANQSKAVKGSQSLWSVMQALIVFKRNKPGGSWAFMCENRSVSAKRCLRCVGCRPPCPSQQVKLLADGFSTRYAALEGWKGPPTLRPEWRKGKAGLRPEPLTDAGAIASVIEE